MVERRATLIINPRAGRGAHDAHIIRRFCESLSSRGVALDVAETDGPGAAARLAADAVRDGARDLIVRGGDGTVHEAIQGLVGTGARILVWPAGTSNVLARQLALPSDPEGAARVFARGNTKQITLGSATSEATGERRYFFMLAGVGVDASVVSQVRPAMKRRVGEAAFWYAGLGQLARWRPVEFRIEIEGESFDATYAAIGKAPWYGGGLRITPRARLDAEEFEVCAVVSRSRLRYLYLLGRALGAGADRETRGVCFRTARSVRATGRALVQADGEIIGNLPMNFEMERERLDVLVP